MQIMQISSLTMHDTKMYEAESDSMEKNWPRISHKINDWLINQISTGISLPIIALKPPYNPTTPIIRATGTFSGPSRFN